MALRFSHKGDRIFDDEFIADLIWLNVSMHPELCAARLWGGGSSNYSATALIVKGKISDVKKVLLEFKHTLYLSDKRVIDWTQSILQENKLETENYVNTKNTHTKTYGFYPNVFDVEAVLINLDDYLKFEALPRYIRGDVSLRFILGNFEKLVKFYYPDVLEKFSETFDDDDIDNEQPNLIELDITEEIHELNGSTEEYH